MGNTKKEVDLDSTKNHAEGQKDPFKIQINCKLFYLLFFLSGLLIGYFFSYHQKPEHSAVEERRLGGEYKFINPLLECTDEIGTSVLTQDIRDKVNNFIKTQINAKKATEVSVYYRDLNNGPWFGYNEKNFFSPASLVKVPLMIAYFKEAENGSGVLSEKIKNTLSNTDELYSEMDYQPEIKMETGTEYTVEDLILRTVAYSDNVAYKLLFDRLDNSKFLSLFRDFGVDVSKAITDPTGNSLSLKDYASFFRILYNSSYLNKEYSEKALTILSQSTYKRGIVAGVPKDIVVAHKFGERFFTGTGEKQLHDCGIVYTDNPYLLCIMTKGSNFEDLENILGTLSSMTYQYFNQK